MVMAAGLGTRLRPFTDRRPKPLLPLMGVPMAQYALDAVAEVGVSRVVANIHAHAQLCREQMPALDLHGAELRLSDETAELLGSGGGVRTALDHLGGEPFFLLNADTLSDINLSELAKTHQRLRTERGATLTLTIFRKAPAGGKYREILVDPATSMISSLGELQSEKPFFVGVAVIEPEAIRHLPAGKAFEFVPEILKPAVDAGKAGAFVSQGLWFDVGSPSLWHDAHLKLMQAWEDGLLPARWRARIEHQARRLSKGRWSGAGWQADLGRRSVVYGSESELAEGRIAYDGLEVVF